MIDGRTVQTVHGAIGAESEFPEGDAVAKRYGYGVTCAVPLMREGEAIGAIAIRRISPELLNENQIAVIRSFASQAAIAIGNVYLFNKTVRLLKETEQRNSELAVINTIQQAVGSALDFQSIVDVVGDKLREVFATGDMGIFWWDEETRLSSSLYGYEHGVRLHFPPQVVKPDSVVARFYRERKVRLVNSQAEQAALGLDTIPGTDQSRSVVTVPMMAGERIFGALQLENHERDNAFGPAEVRLLETITASMAVALLNAKSYEAERQRAAELAIVNSVQAGLASKLDMQAIYDLVGDKIREIFSAQGVGIGVYDPATGLVTIPYLIERGRRIDAGGPRAPAERGFGPHVRRTGQTLIINTGMAERMAEFGEVTQQGETPKSALWVPLRVAEQSRGAITVQDLDRENAFTEADARLLETLAASMSVALENARLFDETQRLVK
jgi:GAF domain-containing protein